MTEPLKSMPDLTQQPIVLVDSTPDKHYPIRLLEVYRENCNCLWSDNLNGEEIKNPMFILMNQHQADRAKLLDKAIAILKEYYL